MQWSCDRIPTNVTSDAPSTKCTTSRSLYWAAMKAGVPCFKRVEPRLDGLVLGDAVKAAGDAGLVADEDEGVAGGAERAQSGDGAREQLDVGGVGQVVALGDDGAVAVQEGGGTSLRHGR